MISSTLPAMRLLWQLAASLCITTIPVAALAAQETVLDFQGGNQPGQWQVTPGMEATASRRLSPDMKQYCPEIPWPKVAVIGNVLGTSTTS